MAVGRQADAEGREVKPRQPIPRASKKRLAANGGKMYSTIAKKSRIRKRPRKPSAFKRIYGSKERVKWVNNSFCAACGILGFSENAHVAPASEKGTGYKADAKWIVPLCGPRIYFGPRAGFSEHVIGCHRLFDVQREEFNRRFPDFNALAAAAKTQADWLAFSGGK